MPGAPGPVSLQETVCWALVPSPATLPDLVARVQQAQPGLGYRPGLAGLVHRSLGSLIRARKVYYTGQGYFLVKPDKRWDNTQQSIHSLQHPILTFLTVEDE